MSFLLALAAQAAAAPTVATMPIDVLPASAKAVVDHVDALYRGKLDEALTFVAEDVENSVSDLRSNLRFPAGRTIAKASYLAATNRGQLSLSTFACKREEPAVRCDFTYGTGKKARNFTMRYWANGGPITRIYSWENHPERRK